VEEIMQDSSDRNSDGATSVLLPLFLASLAINVLQHSWFGRELTILQQADSHQQQKISQLQAEKTACESKFQGFIEGRR
jgi:hypothetical protein